ncbi:hypothetical protein BCR39DRAFT_519954 [Naematelia encephala]|uniref:Protein BIG1 n=1 Tax=Naematelia encephala TaxID=71784 RepID=A0A1Y2BF47_9TREE|nr:hypothetical protein BCR39DRAFT_519954 [Naematelia encephala]
MRSQGLLIALALSLPSALAFKDTSPLLIWASEPNDALRDASEAVTSGVIRADEVYGTISSLGCTWERMAVVTVKDLHASHISALTLPASKADLHIPYLVRPDTASFEAAIDEWALVCGAGLSSGIQGLDGPGRRIVRLEMDKQGDTLKSLSNLSPPPDLILLHGSPLSSSSSSSSTRTSPSVATKIKRQEYPFPPSSSSSSITTTSTATSTSAPGNSTKGPLLDRVQILTTPIIVALLISFLIFIPIVGLGVSALAGIQVPPRMMEIGKGLTVGKDRKDQ